MYKYVNALIDALTGFNLSSELDRVMAMDRWTSGMIAEDQKAKFQKLSDIAARSEYYSAYKGKPLEAYPVMYREELKKNLVQIETHIRKPYSIQHTSGSTGSPVTLVVSREMLLAKRVSHQKVLSWHGVSREAPEFKIGGVEAGWTTKMYYLLRNKRYINSFRICEEGSGDIIRKYNAFAPVVLYGYPSTIFNLILYAEKNHLKMHSPELLITHAEALYPEFTEKFQSVFPNSRILNQYWSTEANIAETCPEGNLHIDEDTVICELVNKDKNGTGDLLVTNLYSYDLPLIRYKIGDRARFSDKECACGRKTKVIASLEGREVDYLDLPDGRNIPVTAFYFSRFAKNILAYQMVYFRKDGLMEFRYKVLDENEPIESGKIAEHLKNDYGLTTRFVRVEELQYTEGGKFKKLLFGD